MKVSVVDPSNFTIPYDNLLCSALARGGADVSLFGRTPRDAETPPDSAFKFYPHYYRYSEQLRQPLGALSRPIKAFEHATDSAALLRRFKADIPDVVHFQWLVIPSFDARLVRRLPNRIARVATVHDTKLYHGTRVSHIQVRGWLDALREFDKLIVHTDHSESKLLELGIPNDKICVVPHGVLPLIPKAMSNKASRGVVRRDTNKLSLLLFGHLKPYKGIYELVDAISLLSDNEKELISLTIAGKLDDSLANLDAYIKDKGCAKLIQLIPGFLPDEDLDSLIGRSDVLLFPYHVIDASGAFMAVIPYGKAIIASDIGIFHELLTDNQNAILVTPKDATDLSNAIRRLATEPETLATIVDGAHLLRESIPSWKSIAEMTSAVYTKALATRALYER